jgi:hypothetical protein
MNVPLLVNCILRVAPLRRAPTLYSAPVWYPGAVYRQGVNVLPDKAGIFNEE